MPQAAPPKVVLFGYDELLLASLDFVSAAGADIVGVVVPETRTDPRANRVRELVAEKGHSWTGHPRGGSGELAEKLRSNTPDLFLVWSYPMILTEDVLAVPRHGTVNIHLGLLPDYRGVNGVRWALLNGEDATGVTMHYMDAGIDSGDMISRAAFPIEPTDDIRTLMQKSRFAGLHLLRNMWQHISVGTAVRMPQEHAKARYYSAAMAPPDIIDWSRAALDIHNLVRASVLPFPGVHTFFGDNKLTIRRTEPLQGDSDLEPGTVVKLDGDSFHIAAGEGKLAITAVELDGEPAAFNDLVALGLEKGRQLTP